MRAHRVKHLHFVLIGYTYNDLVDCGFLLSLDGFRNYDNKYIQDAHLLYMRIELNTEINTTVKWFVSVLQLKITCV